MSAYEQIISIRNIQDSIFIIQQIIEKTYSQKELIYFAFTDMEHKLFRKLWKTLVLVIK